MKYVSTRDDSHACSFEDAICSGYAPDQGLYVPENLPLVSCEILQQWSQLSYPKLTLQILRLFISSEEINNADLESICDAALSGFDHPDYVPVREVGGIYVAELFHGPTFCFKDLGLRALVSLLSYFATHRKRHMTLLVATTGDTGPAAVQAVSDIANPLLTILVHYPKGQISDFQRKQLTTVKSEYVKVVAFEGGGDDMDRPIKNLLKANNSDASRDLTGVNSYNIGRPLMQMVHFVWAYLRVAEKLNIKPGDPCSSIDFYLPTGAMGNLAGGYMAKCMGVPLGMLCAGVNVNDITYRVVKTGKFYKSDKMEMTLSEAINIQLPYNFERILYYVSGGDTAKIKQWMTTVDDTDKNDLPSDWLDRLQREFRSERITDDEMCLTIRKVQDQYQYTIDPHTAVAFATAERIGYFQEKVPSKGKEHDRPAILLSTASPCKFEEAVTAAVGKDGWKRYFETEFPRRAKIILEEEETEPFLYRVLENARLEDSQKEWEMNAQRILQNLQKVGRWNSNFGVGFQ